MASSVTSVTEYIKQQTREGVEKRSKRSFREMAPDSKRTWRNHGNPELIGIIVLFP